MSDHYVVNKYRGTSTAWDIEDLVKVGKKLRACPYYGVRELKIKSHIVFCPYNYLVEPIIRKSMEISLKNNIVILDEAHNIEDSARSAASGQLQQNQIRESMADLEKMAKFYGDTMTSDPDPYLKMIGLLSKVSNWIDTAKDEGPDQSCQTFNDYGQTSKVWTGTYAVAKFKVLGFGPEEFKEKYAEPYGRLVADIQSIKEEEAKVQSEQKMPSLHVSTLGVLEEFFTVMHHIYDNDQKFRDDFRVALVKKQESFKNKTEKGKKGQWMAKGRPSFGSVLDYTYSAHFWCLNPAVIFHGVKEEVRSIVLTSGTLSPMTSFSSELSVEFPITLEANHVIDKKQVWIGTLSHGPTGTELKATYQHTESFQFQDEVGRVTLAVCNTIAHGVLLFLPSYSLLNKLCERWQNTGLWNELCNKKVVISEPRFADEFESSMRHFYEVIESTTNYTKEGVNGALFIAVCRGKVSEGLDFADNNARAVICLGIPFPNIRSAEVNLKMKYNDLRHNKEKTILTGKEWYEIQAFRALNQALGRCIRHRRDWGAILMVDQRYCTNKGYVNSLSKWVRTGVQHNSNCSDVMDQLTTFQEEMVEMDQNHKAEIAKEMALNPTTPASKLKDTLEKFKPNDNNDSKTSHPKGLKGKEIGMHYKDKYAQKQMGNTNSQNVYQNKMVFAPKQKVPMNEWVKQGPSRFVSPESSTNSLPTTSQTPTSDSSVSLNKENSPMKKKFKFSPSAAQNFSIFNKNDTAMESGNDEISTANNGETQMEVDQPVISPVIAKRKGFVAPRQKPDFYGDSGSDDDFQ